MKMLEVITDCASSWLKVFSVELIFITVKFSDIVNLFANTLSFGKSTMHRVNYSTEYWTWSKWALRDINDSEKISIISDYRLLQWDARFSKQIWSHILLMKEIYKRLTETIKFNFSFLCIYYEQYEFDWYLIIVIIKFHNETAAKKEQTECFSERNQDKILYVILLFRDAKWIWRTLIGIISSRTEWDQDTDEKQNRMNMKN